LEGNEMAFVEQKAENEKLKIVRFEVPQLLAFRFTFLVFITSLAILVFIIGCPSIRPEPDEVKVTKPELNKVEIAKPEPNELEVAKSEPNEVKIAKPEPNEVEIAKPEPNELEVAKPEPNKVGHPSPTPHPNVPFHDKCAGILTSFVDDDGMVDYKMLRRKRSELSKLLDEFAKLDRNEYSSWPKEDKIAFWINAYNIHKLKIIVDNYPIKSYRWLHVLPGWGPYSIQHIGKRIGGIDKQKFMVMNEVFTLREIERRFFREKFDEPRVFFTLFRATLSSPPLRNEPYYGCKLDKQLDDQTKKFLSSRRAFKIDRKKQRVYLSPILQPTWFGKEFSSKYATDKKFKEQQQATRAVLNFITNYVSAQDISFLEVESYSVKYIRYDWRLNDGS
jgi:hypothetical protein